MDWLQQFQTTANNLGTSEYIGAQHCSAFIDRSNALFISFETIQSVFNPKHTRRPVGWEAAERLGWSSLTLVSDGDTWFRAPEIYSYFDKLIDNGFFDRFDRVVTYGAGSGGYAAAAFSVVAPGATVIAIQPQATLDPSMTGWDERFCDMRRLCFTDRYGYAPDMLDAAERAYIVYDPGQSLDAMHAALFRASHITDIRLRHLGGMVQSNLMGMGVFDPLVDMIAIGQYTPDRFARLWRARRDHQPYLRSLMAQLGTREHVALERRLCKYVTDRMEAPRFSNRLRELDNAPG